MTIKEYKKQFPWLIQGCTLNQLYDPAIVFARGEPDRAKLYFEALIKFHKRLSPLTSSTLVEQTIKNNIGYWAADHTQVDRENVIKIYNAHHPILPLECSTEEAFELGKQMAERISIEKLMREEIEIKTNMKLQTQQKL